MGLKLVHIASQTEQSDTFHLARLLLLLKAAEKKSNKPVAGITKLAKMDFLVRYPNCLARVLKREGKKKDTGKILPEEENTIEAKMIRFRYGPWDKRYRRWIGLLVAKELANTYIKGRTVNVMLTEKGRNIASELSKLEEFEPIERMSKLTATYVGDYPATKLKNYIYEVFPEIINMNWGESIEL